MCTAESYLRGNLVLSHLVTYKQAAVLLGQLESTRWSNVVIFIFLSTIVAAVCTS